MKCLTPCLAAIAALTPATLAGPPNDACGNATAIGEGSVAGTTVGATNDGAGGCGASGTAPDVWYRHTATASGELEIDTCSGTSYDSVLGVWNGCPSGGGTEIACNDDSCGLQSGLSVVVSAGTEYWIRVSGFAGATGSFTLQVGTSNNDSCLDAIEIGEETVSGSTVGATSDGTGSCGSSDDSPDVWYRYTAPFAGTLDIDTCVGSDYDTVLGIWDGCPATGGNEIACNDDDCGVQSGITLEVLGGEEYWIRVAGFNGAVGDFSLTVDQTFDGGSVGPDVIYTDCVSITNWGAVGGVRAYSLGSYTCNIGDQNLDWGGTSPLLAMNAYRLHDGRLVQIGQSFVKNGTVAAAGSGCGLPCSGQGGGVLGAGCRDIYGASYNGGQGILGPRSDVNAYTGAYPGASGGSGDSTYKRLQIREADLSLPGALYFVEGVYVAWDDAQWGNALNNASYKQVTVSAGSFNLTPTGSMQVTIPAIQAWADNDPDVTVVPADVPGEGRFHMASKVTDLGGGQHRYDYAVFNLNSHRSGGSFSVPIPSGASVTNVGFHDVEYHSGEPFDNTNWTPSIGATSVTWESPQTHAENPDSNALRFGTMYNFWFETDVAPGDGAVTLGLFRPGTPDSIDIDSVIPGGDPGCPADVTGDGEVDVEDLVEVVLNWGPCPGCAGDVTGDGDVDVEDLVEIILNWGPC